MYQSVAPRIVEALREIADRDDVFFGPEGAEKLEPYGHD
jgi:hypothetical protein